MKEFFQRVFAHKVLPMFGKISLALILAVGLTSSVFIQPSSAAFASGVYLTVYCPSNLSPSGMWYSGQYTHQQGWARLNSVSGNRAVYSFGLTNGADTVSLSIGCGRNSSGGWLTARNSYLDVYYSPIESALIGCSDPNQLPRIYPWCVSSTPYNGYQLY